MNTFPVAWGVLYGGIGISKYAKFDQKVFLKNFSCKLLFCTYGVNIFIDYRPACRDTEKGGKGERDTGTTTRNGVTRCVARGYLRSSSLRMRGSLHKRSPPTPYPHWDKIQQPRYILRMASNLEAVSMTADTGQQQ